MPPAISPARRELAPSWAGIELTDTSVKDSGSAPYLSSFTSWVACCCVNGALPGPLIVTWLLSTA